MEDLSGLIACMLIWMARLDVYGLSAQAVSEKVIYLNEGTTYPG